MADMGDLLQPGYHIPEGLHRIMNDNGEDEIRDSQDVLWVTIHSGGMGDTRTWRETIILAIEEALGTGGE